MSYGNMTYRAGRGLRMMGMIVTQGSVWEILVLCQWLFCPRECVMSCCESVEFEWIGEWQDRRGCL